MAGECVGRYESPIGVLLVRWSAAGLRAIKLCGEGEAPDDLGQDAVGRAVRQALDEYFAGKQPRLSELPLDAAVGTDFQRAVWDAISRIPWGETLSYGEVATLVGKPNAARAVGTASGKNPLALLVPCHRVIAAGGKLGGYGGRLDQKRWLLRHEGTAP